MVETTGTQVGAPAELPAAPQPGWRQQARAAGETLVPLVIAGFGLLQVLKAPPDSWSGLALAGLALVFYLVRGQLLGKATFGKDGISVEMLNNALATATRAEQKVETVAVSAAEAQETATAAKQLAGQSAVPGGKTNAGGEGRSETAEAGAAAPSGWSHPGLMRKEAPANDPQKGQWGERDTRNQRRLSATVEPVGDDLFEVTLIVQPVEAAPPITDSVRFHLHDTFPRQVRTVEAEDGKAKLTLIAWGAFTVGAEVRNEPDTYLELDLADPAYGYPKKFRDR